MHMRQLRRTVFVAFVLWAAWTCATPVVAQDEKPKNVQLNIHLLAEPSTLTLVLDSDSFVAWLKPVAADIEKLLAKETDRRTIVVQVSLHPDRAGDVEVAGRPTLGGYLAKALRSAADMEKAPRSRVVDLDLRLEIQVNGGDPDQDKPLDPPLPTPQERRLAAFEKATIAEKAVLMKQWARTRALPIIAAATSLADPKFEGVRNLGKAIGAIKADDPIDVPALTDKSRDFWRAMLEMSPGNPLAAAARVALLTANGEFDHARRAAGANAPFDNRQSGFSQVLSEFRTLDQIFSMEVEGKVQAGIAKNDAGDFAGALVIFDALLRDYPKSAWARYERFHTLRTQALKEGKGLDATPESWAATRKAILDSDPLYTTMAEAKSPDELYGLLIRREIDELFQAPESVPKALLRYADIALDLDQPGFAAMLYWGVFTSVPPADYGERKVVEDMLYCLEKLGVKDLKEGFRGDHKAEFARIDAERTKRKRESSPLKAIADPDSAKDAPDR